MYRQDNNNNYVPITLYGTETITEAASLKPFYIQMTWFDCRFSNQELHIDYPYLYKCFS